MRNKQQCWKCHQRHTLGSTVANHSHIIAHIFIFYELFMVFYTSNRNLICKILLKYTRTTMK